MSASTGPAAVAPGKLPIVERSTLIGELADVLEAARAEGSLFGVIVVEIARFDEIIHDYGYAVGDALVEAVTALLAGCKRPVDRLARVGTHEFALLLPGLRSTGQPMLAAQRVQGRNTGRLAVAGRHLRPNLRLGVAVFPHDADGAEELLHRADAALMQGRRLNQDIVTFAESRVGFETALLETQYDLGLAIDNGELYCEFQPKVELQGDRLHGVEALCRWRTASGAMVSPGRFIPAAEQSGLITPLTFRTLNESLRECAELQPVLPGLGVAVNLSAAVFGERHLEDIIVEALHIWRVPSERLVLEVTESAVMNDIESSIRTLKKFRDLGIGVSIDDFGTGHSSLAYLRRLPATELKIDRSFVRNLATSDGDRKLVGAIIDLSSALGLATVAEGIEDAATLAVLRDLGCTLAQGFHIARPLAPATLPGWLVDSPWQPPRTDSPALRRA